MNVFFHTFGCKANSCETRAIAALLEQNGYFVTDDLQEADVVIVNSCAVTAASDRKARGFIRRAKRLNEGAVTVLTGCYPQAFPESSCALETADIVTGNAAREDLPSIISRYLEAHERIAEIPPHLEGAAFWHVPTDTFHGHTRAFMKIQDGCDRSCRFCVVPRARGFVRSMSLDNIGDQAARFARGGYREIVLSGVNLSSYGKGEGFGLEAAVFAADVPGVARIRLSSLEPDLVSDCLINSLSKCAKLCPHFHLPLQSGCDKTLASMGRLYSVKDYERVVSKLRGAFDTPTFTTDVIAGFPNESDEDFRESLDFISGFGFLKCHVFPYSARPGTAASSLPQLPKKLREERAKTVAAAAEISRKKILAGQVGTTALVIAEKETSDGVFEGYSERYIPVEVRAKGAKVKDLVESVITGVRGGVCTAKVK